MENFSGDRDGYEMMGTGYDGENPWG